MEIARHRIMAGREHVEWMGWRREGWLLTGKTGQEYVIAETVAREGETSSFVIFKAPRTFEDDHRVGVPQPDLESAIDWCLEDETRDIQISRSVEPP